MEILGFVTRDGMGGQKLESKSFEAIALICFEYLDDGFGRDCVRDLGPSADKDFC